MALMLSSAASAYVNAPLAAPRAVTRAASAQMAFIDTL